MDIESTSISDVPVTILRAPPETRAPGRGLVLCYHGYDSSTADWLDEIAAFARAGFVTVGRDENVPGAHATAFHERLAARFPDRAERFRHIDYARSAHHMNADDWRDAVDRACRWFARHVENPPEESSR